MLRRQNSVFHSRLPANRCPAFCIKISRVKLIKVFFVLLNAHFFIGHHPFAPCGNCIKAPVDEHSEAHRAEFPCSFVNFPIHFRLRSKNPISQTLCFANTVFANTVFPAFRSMLFCFANKVFGRFKRKIRIQRKNRTRNMPVVKACQILVRAAL